MSKIKLKKISPSATGRFKSKDDAHEIMKELQKKLYDLLYLMFAHDKYSLLIILHGIDTSGKDGAVKHIFDSANPQGVRVFSFKKPTPEELRHDFIWRCHKHTPECGLTAIFNRSYYEDVTTVMVHPEFLEAQRIPKEMLKQKDFFNLRYQRINDFEKMLNERGTVVLKFFLHISKKEQKERLQDRLKDKSKNWKFSENDVKERMLWNEYAKVFEKMINNTNTKHAPWHVVAADHKWHRDYVITKAIVDRLSQLKMEFPKIKYKISNIE